MGFRAWLSSLFSKQQQNRSASFHAMDFQGPAWGAGNDDILDGVQFCATMQLRTPLRVLKRHGETHTQRGSAPPAIACQEWEGIWVSKLCSPFDELSVGVTMASDVGPIPADGGDYLKMLIAVRTVVEASMPVFDRRRELLATLDQPQWGEYVDKLGGRVAIADKFFPPFLSTIKGLPTAATSELVRMSLDTPNQLIRCDDRTLLALNGIGSAKLAAIRAASEAAQDKSAAYIESPICTP